MRTIATFSNLVFFSVFLWLCVYESAFIQYFSASEILIHSLWLDPKLILSGFFPKEKQLLFAELTVPSEHLLDYRLRVPSLGVPTLQGWTCFTSS